MVFVKLLERKQVEIKCISMCLLLIAMLLIGCQHESKVQSIEDERYKDKEALGEALFFDTALSLDSSISCATCHKPDLAFADHNARAIGIFGRESLRNVPSILNVKNLHAFLFDASVPTLEMQALVPIQDSNEMGMPMGALIKRLHTNQAYRSAAKRLFKRDFDAFVLTRSLAAYQRTLVSNDSPFDAYLAGDRHALSASARRGWKLFSERLYCTACHPAPNFTIDEARNSGYMSNLDEDPGRYRHTGKEADRNAFKVPSLRNVALTYPYMHDGSIENLETIITYYEKGERHAGVDSLIQEFSLSDGERQDLLAFLKSLSGEGFQKANK